MLQGKNFKVINKFSSHHLIKSGNGEFLLYKKSDLESKKIHHQPESEYCLILRDLDDSVFGVSIDNAILIDRLLNGWEVIERKLNSERSEW